MDYFDKNVENQRKIERIVLTIYCIYNIGTSAIVKNNGWNDGIIFFLNAGWLLSLIVYVGRYKNYRFRAFLTSILLQLGVIFYAMQVPDLLPNLVTVLAVVAFLGLYGISAIIYITAGSVTFLFLYHTFVLRTITSISKGMISSILQQVVSVYLTEYIVYYLVKKQAETNTKQLETIQELKEAERSKDDFLANVSHEIRTPINTICGMSEVLLRETDIPEKIREDVFNIQTAGRNLQSVVSDILDFSELQSGKMELVEIAYNITSTINDVINMTMARKSEKNIDLIVDCNANLPSSLLGDEQKIRRVIMNLVNNAIKFTHEGYVSIIISFRKTTYGINLSVKVKDTGIGMKEESLEKLFTSFNQVDTKRNRQEGGIGLGLAISRAIIDEMGGFITVKSEFGKGTEVKFVIPQKVLDETPITSLNEPEKINIAAYLKSEQFAKIETWDEYARNINHMMEQLAVKCHIYENLTELKRRVEGEDFTHLFISFAGYQEEEAYFDKLSLQKKVIIVLNRSDEKKIHNPHLLRLYKPFFVLPIVLMLNNENVGHGLRDNRYYREGFIAPDVHVLVVDDNLMNIRVLEGLLHPYKIKVTKATSGAEALKKIETMEYDFVFMDHMMPEMDGIETLRRIRQKQGKYFLTVPVIALTANAIGGTREMFLSEGFQDFVAKPLERSVLERVLKRNISRKKIIKVTNYEKSNEKEVEENREVCIGDFDVEKGIIYCGSLKDYLEVLKMQYQNATENMEKLEQFYRQRDWKNYTILVHSLKSTMQSVGVTKLSQMAKKLEQAAKEENEEFIINRHGEMMEEYKRIVKIMQEDERINTDAKEQAEENLKILEDAEFDFLVQKLEAATYTLEGEKILAVLAELQQYSYRGNSLNKLLEPVKRKVEMSDFMSALDVVMKLKDKLKGQS